MTRSFGGLLPDQLVAAEPAWADLAALRALALIPWDGRDEPPIRIGHHPLFEPWREQIIRTAALAAPLFFGDDPGERVASRGGGQLAHMSSSDPPHCRLCGALLTLCFQLQPELIAPWLRLDGALTAAYCFACHPSQDDPWHDYANGKDFDGTEACRITVEQPLHLVAFGEPREGPRELSAPLHRWSFPDLMNRPLPTSGAMRFMLMNASFEVRDEYLALVAERHGYRSPHCTGGGEQQPREEQWRTALGGYPSWDQEDVTPTCGDCGAPMKLVVDYNGYLFLDGALHVFACICDGRLTFRFVAEF